MLCAQRAVLGSYKRKKSNMRRKRTDSLCQVIFFSLVGRSSAPLRSSQFQQCRESHIDLMLLFMKFYTTVQNTARGHTGTSEEQKKKRRHLFIFVLSPDVKQQNYVTAESRSEAQMIIYVGVRPEQICCHQYVDDADLCLSVPEDSGAAVGSPGSRHVSPLPTTHSFSI